MSIRSGTMEEIIDKYTWSDNTQLLTQDVHNIPGLKNFAHQRLNTSSDPIPLHFHSNILEIYVLLKGERFTILEKDGKISSDIMHGNEAFIVFPFEHHGNGSLPRKPSEFYALQIDLSDKDHLLCLSKEYSNSLYEQLLGIKTRHMRITTSNLTLLSNAFHLISEGCLQDHQTGVALLAGFLFNLCRTASKIPSHSDQGKMNLGIKQAVDYINQNITRTITLSKLASVSGYSLSHFKTLFKEELGVTPHDYITDQKIGTAKKMLETSDKSVTEISFSLGFSSSNYFSSVFRKLVNCSPSEYRKKA